MVLDIGERQLLVDLAFERDLMTATKSNERIAVEVQSFLSKSALTDLYRCLGQYIVYRTVLARMSPEIKLYIAITEMVANGIWDETLGRLIQSEMKIPLVIFDPILRKVTRWTA
jgi:hypothetical protein